MAVLLCPLCSQPRFNNLESLRSSLVNAATQNISCPICSEVLMGLDKLTIHLFGHTLNQSSDRPPCLELKISKLEDVTHKTNTEGLNCISTSCYSAKSSFESDIQKEQTDYILREFPEAEQKIMEESSKNCTVNMEDLSFLTSWENSLRSDDLKNSENQSSEEVHQTENEFEKTTQENSAELSEYMSDLLNKKLPVLNFVCNMESTEKLKLPQEPERKNFQCQICNFVFQNSVILSMHQELVHSNTKTDNENESTFQDFSSEKKSLKNLPSNEVFENFILPLYNCHLCSKSFKMKGSLLIHYRVVHLGINNPDSVPSSGCQYGSDERNFKCSICSKSFKKEQHLTQHIKTHQGKQWKCETCNKYFTTKYFLKKHQRLHTGEMPYSCQTCSKTFTFQQSYHKHLLYHSDEKPHQCSECGRSFKELSTLHNHQRIHSGEKPFTCETCGKCFRQRVSYIVHQRIHTGVLPYQCTACKKKFRYKVSQRSHKCTAQPPGVVVRQPGDLVQKILQQRNEALRISH